MVMKTVLDELELKLRRLQILLRLFGKAAHRIQAAHGDQQDHSDALLIINECIDHSRRTLNRLGTCRGKLKSPENRSMLRLAIRYFCYENGDKSVVEKGLKEIDEGIGFMQVAITCVLTYVLARVYP